MDETVYAAEVHEHTVVGNVLDNALEDLAFLELADELCPLLLLLRLKESLV